AAGWSARRSRRRRGSSSRAAPVGADELGGEPARLAVGLVEGLERADRLGGGGGGGRPRPRGGGGRGGAAEEAGRAGEEAGGAYRVARGEAPGRGPAGARGGGGEPQAREGVV